MRLSLSLFDLYMILLLLSAVSAIALAVFAYRRRQVRGAAAFVLLMFLASLWSFGEFFEISSGKFIAKVFWLNVQQIGTFGTSITWFLFALVYTGRETWLEWKRLLPVISVPVMAVMLIWTNDYHHLMRETLFLIESDHFSVVGITRGPLSLSFVLFSFLLVLASLLIFLNALRKTPAYYRRQLHVFILSLLIPMLIDILETVGIRMFASASLTPIAFILSGLWVGWGLFRFHLFDIWPIARDQIIEGMKDGVFVVDPAGRITDFNPSALRLIEKGSLRAAGQLRGQAVGQVLGQWPAWMRAYETPGESRLEIEVEDDPRKQYMEVRISPLFRKGKILGMLTILHDITERKRIEEELTRRAQTDGLTGISNRTYYMELSCREFMRDARYNRKLAVLMMDVDWFKSINDTYGHQIGDTVIIHLTEICLKILRSTDIFGRWGGEEFAITLPESGLDEAMGIAERIRQAVEASVLHSDNGEPIQFTVSIGVSSIHADDRSFDALLNRADKALYIAKRDRNCVRSELLL